jgi:hypothetical protein
MRRMVFAALVLCSAAARAEDPKPGVRVIREPDRIVVRKRTVVDFNDVTVQGELTKPEGSYVLERGKTRFPPLVRLRDRFDRELKETADEVE